MGRLTEPEYYREMMLEITTTIMRRETPRSYKLPSVEQAFLDAITGRLLPEIEPEALFTWDTIHEFMYFMFNKKTTRANTSCLALSAHHVKATLNTSNTTIAYGLFLWASQTHRSISPDFWVAFFGMMKKMKDNPRDTGIYARCAMFAAMSIGLPDLMRAADPERFKESIPDAVYKFAGFYIPSHKKNTTSHWVRTEQNFIKELEQA